MMIDLLTETLKAWMKHRAASRGAALAFYTLFSMVPILLLTVAVAGYFFGDRFARVDVIDELQQLVGPSAATAIRSVLTYAYNPAGGGLTTIVASALLLFAATSVFAELKDSLDEIWGVPKPLYSGIMALIRTRLLSFALVALLAALLLFSLLTSAALAVLENFAAEKWSNAAAFYGVLSSLAAFAIIACLFAVVYKMLPDTELSWSDVWIGAAVTAGLFSLGKYAISLYLAHSVVASVFGAAGSVIALLLWIYYSAQIFLLGAQFTRQYALRFGSHRSARHPSPEAESRSGMSPDPRPARQSDAR